MQKFCSTLQFDWRIEGGKPSLLVEKAAKFLDWGDRSKVSIKAWDSSCKEEKPIPFVLIIIIPDDFSRHTTLLTTFEMSNMDQLGAKVREKVGRYLFSVEEDSNFSANVISLE